jgi:hypothetical protein
LNTGNPAAAAGGAWIDIGEARTGLWVVDPFVDGNGHDKGFRFADLNGDGMVDMIRMHGENNKREVYLNKGKVPDLLTEVTNHLGGTTTVTYSPEVVPGLGVLQVVESIKSDGGAGNPAQEVAYSYTDPECDVADREFHGFRTVTATRASQDNRVVETVYNQGAEDFGLPQRVAVTEPTLGEVRRTEFAYTQDTDGAPFVSLLESKRVLESGETLSRETLTEFVYDDLYGNLEARIEHGDVCTGCTGDDRRWDFDYTVDGDLYLVDTVNRRLLCPGVGACGDQNSIRKTHFYYDGHDDNLYAAPVKGNLTKRVEVLDDPGNPPRPDPTTAFSYDEFANVLVVRDPRQVEASGPGTVMTYDGDYHAFPATITNAKGHQTILTYTPGGECTVPYPAGAGLVQFQQGPNDIAGGTGWVRCYDAFARPTLERAPNDLAETTWTYDDALHKVSEWRRATDSGTLREKTTSFDGLGRVIRTKSSGASGDVQVDRGYDGAGRLASQTDPYYTDPEPETIRETTFDYEVLDRVTKTTRPGQRIDVVKYDAGKVTFKDPNEIERIEWVGKRGAGR